MVEFHMPWMRRLVAKKIFAALARAREPDMREPALFLQAGAAGLVERALMRKQAFLPAGQEHGVEFQPLGGMQRHDVDGVVVAFAVAVHHQRNMFEEAGEVLELLHGAHELLQVFQPPGGIGGTVLLPHLGIAGFIEHDFGQFGSAAAHPSARASDRTR